MFTSKITTKINESSPVENPVVMIVTSDHNCDLVVPSGQGTIAFLCPSKVISITDEGTYICVTMQIGDKVLQNFYVDEVWFRKNEISLERALDKIAETVDI